MKKSVIRYATVSLILSVMLVLVGCGGGKSSTSATSTAVVKDTSAVTNLVASTTDVAAATELSDGTINIGYGTTIDTLTPFRSNTARNAPYLIQMYETLAVMDENKEFQPVVAKSWTTNDNGFTYDFEIYNNVTDSQGNKITSSDIVWFVEEAQKRALKPVFAKVESIEATGEYTFTLKFKSNIVGVLETFFGDVYVISEKAFKESSDEFGTSIVSTSPYKVVKFVPGSSIQMERRDDYWQDVAALPECVRPIQKVVNYQIITEAFQLGVALETGTVDAVIDLASSTGSQFIGKKGFTVDLSDGPQGWQIFFSGASSSLCADNEKLRQAICYSIDANGLITAMCSGYGTQMWDVASPRLLGFNDKWKNEDYYSYDPEKAKQLLKEAGYNGEKLSLLSTSSAFASRLGQLLQNYMTAVGINCELNSMDFALYTAIRLDGTKYDMTINTVGGTALADQWSVRFDPAAYKNGDATSRKDMDLAALIYKGWTVDGWNEESIDAVHYYIKDKAIAYGLVNPQVFTIWSDKISMQKVVKGGISGYVVFSACQINK